MEKKDYSRAILEFSNARQAMPRDAEPYYQIALASLALLDVRTALEGLKKTLDLNPNHAGAQLKMAQLLASASDNKFVAEAETRLKELMTGSPGTSEMFRTLAFAELKLGKTDAAIRTLEQALATAPQELALSVMLARARLTGQDPKGAEAVLKQASDKAPNSAEPRVMLGLFYASQNRLPDAEAEFQRALSIDPKSVTALFNLARLHYTLGRKREAEEGFKQAGIIGGGSYKPVYALFLFEEGRRDEAIREFERLARENPQDRQARTRLVVAYRAENRSADAAKLLSQALDTNGNDVDALLQRGEMFLDTGEIAAAEADLNQVIRLKPDSGEVHYLLARVHRARGATLRYKQELSEALRLNPFLLSARLELVRQLLSDKEHRAASDLIDATPEDQRRLTPVVVQRNWVLWTLNNLSEMRKGIDAGLARERSSDLLVQDAAWKLRTGNAAGARAAVEEGLKINPSDVRALGLLSLTYSAMKQGPMAVEKIREYGTQQPNSAPVQEFLGIMLMGAQDRGQARQAFEKAKAADPKLTRADLYLAQIDLLEGKTEDAQRRLEGVLLSDHSNSTARLWLANLQSVKGDKRAALEHFRRVVAAEPRNPQALNNLAYLIAEVEGKPAEALKYAQQAKELVPASAEYSDTLGWIFYRQGLYPMAVKELERAAATPGNAVWKYHLAMAYAKSGDIKRGRAVLRAALEKNPHLPEAKLAQEMLGETK